MKLFDDMIMLELQKDEWEAEQRSGMIVKPDSVKSAEEGPGQERIPFHFFKVVGLGPDCSERVKLGDRLFPKPPTLYNPGQLKGVIVWINGKKEARFVIREADVGGIE